MRVLTRAAETAGESGLPDAEVSDTPSRRRFVLPIIIVLFVLGIVAQFTGLVDAEPLLAAVRPWVGSWWLGPGLALLKAGLYALALPGSSLFWVVGAVFPPAAAVTILACGGTAGALAGYALGRGGSDGGGIIRRRPRLMTFLAGNTTFPALLAARLLPGFPHSLINFGSGLLLVPLPRFVLASILGFVGKGYVYSSTLHRAATAGFEGDYFGAVWPLTVLALILFIANAVRRRWGPVDSPNPSIDDTR